MTTSVTRAQLAIDGDTLIRLAVDNARQLRDQITAREKDLDRLKRILTQTMKDNGATELTVGGEAVVRLTEYTMESVKVSDLREQYPAVAGMLVRRTPVSRMELP